MSVHAYLVGSQNFMHKEFETFEAAQASFARLVQNPHKEKVMWVISERQLTQKEEMMLQVVQVEM